VSDVSVTPGGEQRGSRIARLRSGDPIESLLWIAIALVFVASLGTVLVLFVVGARRQATPPTLQASAVEELSKVVKQRPTVGVGWADYVKALIASGDYNTAANAVQQGLAQTNGSAAVRAEQGRLLLNLGRVDEALKALDTAYAKAKQENDALLKTMAKTGVSPQHMPNQVVIECLVLKGEALAQQQRWREATVAYTGALAEDPTMSDVLVERAQAYMKLHRVDDAAKSAQDALKYEPDNPDALAILKAAKAGGAR
jgi:tetratricopeptide (TPR) repeat protein